MFDCLVISGGSTKGRISISICKRHEKELKSVYTYIGTSVGSVLCTLLSMGFSCSQVMKIGMDSKCEVPTGIGWIGSIGCLLTRLGMIEKNTYLDSVSKSIMDRYGRIPTLLELYQMTGKNLYIIATGLIRRNRIVFSYKTHPHMSVIDALHMSVRMPIIFTPIRLERELVVDGGVVSHFPIDLRVGRTLAIHTYNKVRDIDTMLKEPSLIEYVGLLLSCASPINIPTSMDGVLYNVEYEKRGNMTSEQEVQHMIEIGSTIPPLISN